MCSLLLFVSRCSRGRSVQTAEGGRPLPSGEALLQSTVPIKRSKDYKGGNERTRKGEKELEEERGGKERKHRAGSVGR